MASPTRPGVEVIQQASPTPAQVATPGLIACIAGLCRQIVEVTDDDGALNADALYTDEQYNQASLLVPQASFPNPRSNIDEVNVEEDAVRGFLFFGGKLSELPRGSHDSIGQSFLSSANLAHRATLRSSEADSFAFDATNGDPLTFALDKVNPVDSSDDFTVTLIGTLTAQEVVDEINEIVGVDVASLHDEGGAKHVQITSQVRGAASSITVRAGTSSLKILFGAGFDDSKEYRIEGAGFRGQDDDDDDLTTPWIEYYEGAYREDDADTAFPAGVPSDDVWVGITDEDDAFVQAKAPAFTYAGTLPSVPLAAATASSPGDQVWADGTKVGGGEVIKLEPTRFKLGVIDTAMSTFDDDGNATNRVFRTFEVNTMNHSIPFAPRYLYFVADNLVWGEVSPAGSPATVTGVTQGFIARAGVVQSSVDMSFPINLASLTVDYEVVEDGVSTVDTFTFTGGPFTAISEVVTAMASAIPGVTASASGDRLVLTTDKTGAEQSIAIKSTGTANPGLEFSAVTETQDDGKDVEFAEQATVTGDIISLPLVGLTATGLDLTVVDAKGTHVLSATGVDLSTAATLGALAQDIATALGDPGATKTLYDGGIPVATISTSGDGDASGTLTLTTIEGGISVTLALTATDLTDGLRSCGFYDAVGNLWADIQSTGALTFPLGALSGQTLTIDWDEGAGPTSLTAVLGASEAAASSASALAALLNATAALTDVTAVREVWYVGDDANDLIIVRTLQGGTSLSLDATIGGGTAGATLLLPDPPETGAVSAGNTDDAGADGLVGTRLGFYLDFNPTLYDIPLSTNSLADAIDEINTTLGAATDIATEDDRKLVLTSALKGAASKVEIETAAPHATSSAAFGLSGSDLGAGRPDPDFYLDGLGSANVGASILRNSATGIPFPLVSAVSDLYIQYKGVRLDVTSEAEQPSLLTFSNPSDMDAAIGPVSTDNPLALGFFLAMAAAPDVSISGIGIDEANSASPTGTIDGWARALDFLEAKEVYGVAPLTDDEFIQGLIVTHVTAISEPENRGERVALIWGPVPFVAPHDTVSSGVNGETTGSDNVFQLEVNPSSDLIAEGITDLGSISVDEGLFVEILVAVGGATELRRYSVAAVSGVILTLRVAFASGENDDGFYTTETLNETLINQDWSLRLRGAPLLVAGTAKADLNAVAASAAAQGSTLENRRVFYLFSGDVEVSINGITQRVPGYYAAAFVAGMTSQANPSQPFTRVPMNAIGRVYGTDDTFSENQMDVIADGGRYILVNQGGRAASRHQRSTDSRTIEAREFSITRAIDQLAKGLRSQNRLLIGRNNITPGFLDQLTMINEGFLQSAEGDFVKSADLKSILQSAEDPDTILIEVEVGPFYPANKIRITIVT